jgi:hypothetical protein
MSKISTPAVLLRMTPHSSSRVRTLLPVPDWPKTPVLRWTSRSRSMQTGVSIVSGAPSAKRVSLSSPKTASISIWVAARNSLKCIGILRTGSGRFSSAVSSATSRSTSEGLTWTVA